MAKLSRRCLPARLRLAACLLAVALMLAPLPVRAAWPFFEIANPGLIGYAYAAAAWGDVDGDGDLDVVIAGRPYGSGTGHTTRVYLNDGRGTFAASGIALPGYSSGAAAWGDYDGDGDLDLALCGQTDAGRATNVYRNTGATLEDSGANLVGVDGGSLAWGDADGDGDLDLLVTGCPDGTCSAPVSVVYPNQGGTFGEAVALPVQMGYSDAAWGDYDNDGDLDIAITGRLGGYVTPLLRNQGGLTFVDSGIRLFYDVSDGALAWGDHDGDGDLDLLLSGYNASLGGDYYCVYRNRGPTDYYLAATGFGAKGGSAAWGDYNNDGLPDFA
ncbi:MAG: FG-GAP-like repeat-containing protein, partial [Anaerolineae bacterium]|nr:FG-GAP-like repeat-containing protein [Anaerolineae bacterium]